MEEESDVPDKGKIRKKEEMKQQGPIDSKTSKKIPSSMAYVEEDTKESMTSTCLQTKSKADTRPRSCPS